jgi:hypothetical protein
MRPGFLTREWVQGRRAPYLPPLRLYLICSVLFFAAAAYAPPDASVRMEERRGRTLSVAGVRLSGTLLLGNLSNEEIVERVRQAEHDWLPKFLFALVPVWALLVMVVTRRERRNFPEHLYFALHVLGATFGVRAVEALLRFARSPALSAVWAVLSFVFIVWYVTVALHTVYGRTLFAAFRRAIALLAMYFVVVVITFGAFLTLALKL